jgi:hypothetical protein
MLEQFSRIFVYCTLHTHSHQLSRSFALCSMCEKWIMTSHADPRVSNSSLAHTLKLTASGIEIPFLCPLLVMLRSAIESSNCICLKFRLKIGRDTSIIVRSLKCAFNHTHAS